MTDSPMYVIVHRRVTPRGTDEQVFDIRPDVVLSDVRERAAELQHDANVCYGRPDDTYRVAELRFTDEES